mmetsp:Transcript_14185/g.30344  ORF Transcript_14185/g.30344 Transcript_14185/m.30344 type:complete len:312 (-) Transcript_14185:155-1090(-)|eukprot:CAMPEP_0118935206 /NCGR_PEP_ID=MMETSP1169-20130426/15157_1 /TAXON_ID=36882 /ORGANISM="Pyramimonas obovata, Strain CCMP722" /LENGTH=311 /DNA_ID=CAMNT_0006878203 /DNA_START=26 /DNA_END=961 /DNA_ORIENTATION=-
MDGDLSLVAQTPVQEQPETPLSPGHTSRQADVVAETDDSGGEEPVASLAELSGEGGVKVSSQKPVRNNRKVASQQHKIAILQECIVQKPWAAGSGKIGLVWKNISKTLESEPLFNGLPPKGETLRQRFVAWMLDYAQRKKDSPQDVGRSNGEHGEMEQLLANIHVLMERHRETNTSRKKNDKLADTTQQQLTGDVLPDATMMSLLLKPADPHSDMNAPSGDAVRPNPNPNLSRSRYCGNTEADLGSTLSAFMSDLTDRESKRMALEERRIGCEEERIKLEKARQEADIAERKALLGLLATLTEKLGTNSRP